MNLIEEVINRYGKIDILINNAGITRDRTFRKLSNEEWSEVIDVNLNSVFYTTYPCIMSAIIFAKRGYLFSMRLSFPKGSGK